MFFIPCHAKAHGYAGVGVVVVEEELKDKTQEGIPLDELQESTPLINGSGYFRQYGSAPNSVLMVKTPSKKVKNCGK